MILSFFSLKYWEYGRQIKSIKKWGVEEAGLGKGEIWYLIQ